MTGGNGFDVAIKTYYADSGLEPLWYQSALKRRRLLSKWSENPDRHFWASNTLNLSFLKEWSWRRRSQNCCKLLVTIEDAGGWKRWMVGVLAKSNSNAQKKFSELLQLDLNASENVDRDTYVFGRGDEVLNMIRYGSLAVSSRTAFALINSDSKSGQKTIKKILNPDLPALCSGKGRARCPLCEIEKETVEHFLFDCPELDVIRSSWFERWSLPPLNRNVGGRLISTVLQANPTGNSDRDSNELHRIRCIALAHMWRIRCRANNGRQKPPH